MSKWFAEIPLKRNNGPDVNSADALKNKVVLLYFGAYWCPPCKDFVPILKKFYEEAASSGVEIIFITSDRTAADHEAQLKDSGNWLYIPYGKPHSQLQVRKYGVSGMPALILIKVDGTAVNKEAEVDMQSMSVQDAIAKWKKQLG